MIKNHNILSRIYSFVVAIILILAGAGSASAFETTIYAENSVLSEGTWVKISVESTGVHMISDAQLREWGFTDPSKVKVYGYGGQRIANALTLSSFIDDMPLVPCEKTSRGLVFYAQGTVKWTRKNSNYIPSQNPFSTVGYYFLSDRENDNTAIKDIDRGKSTSTPNVNFPDYILHEIDEYSPGKTGHMLLGEDFRHTPSRTFNLELTDISNDEAKLTTSFFAKTHSGTSKLTFTINGETLPPTPSGEEIIGKTDNSSYYHGVEKTIIRTFNISGSKLTLGLKHSSNVSVLDARLNYIAVTYDRHLRMRDGHLNFRLLKPSFILEGATADTRVWDVTKPNEALSLTASIDGNGAHFVNQYTGAREYVAWNENGNFPSPKFVCNVTNQNIHAEETPDMVIFTIKDWESQAQRIADYHKEADGMKVLVVDQELVFNEFSSGIPDPNGFRRMLKMFWDRGNESGTPLRYALFMGRQFFDNRRLTNEGKSLTYKTMPSWQTDISTDDNSSFTTDDIYAFLEDGSGASMGSDKICIAVGRMPVRSVENAKAMVDKLFAYIKSMPSGEWKNHMLFVADDEDNGIHLDQTEKLITGLQNSQLGDRFFYDKVYIDAYTKYSGTYPDARDKMFRLLNEGSMWWNYIGHANTTSWTGEKILTTEDMSNLYLDRLPILYAATCDFFRWDDAAICGAEVMFNLENGGIIGGISATRPVYITENGLFSLALSRQLLKPNEEGKLRTLGEIFVATKNNITDDESKPISNSNRLRYVLLGDPAMPLSAPNNLVKINKINGKEIDPENTPQLMARQEVPIEGAVYDPVGQTVLSDFNGTISVTLYDAEKSVTTLGHGENGSEDTFEEQGSRLLVSTGKVENGLFSLKLIIPSETTDNYRFAALNMAAYTIGDNKIEAIGCERNLYVYGMDENAEADSEAPVIESFVLNHTTFANGDHVNDSPMVIAHVSDNRAINLSTAGIGRQMMLYLDDTEGYTDVPNYYTTLDSQREGEITYPLEGLLPGDHTLRLRVWDTSGNYAESTITFTVDEEIAPTIYDVYSDANPASVEANFYVTHDRPDAMATLTVSIYNMLGAEIWSSTVNGKSDMFKSVPVKWDLTDRAGRRVGRGIYLYRAEITTDGKTYNSKTKRIAVTAR